MRYLIALTLLAGIALTTCAQVPRRVEPLAEQVKQSIAKGVKYLRRVQRPNGSWEVDLIDPRMRGGWSCLALLALLNSGVPANDPAVARGLDWLRRQEFSATYVRALQTMVYAEAGQLGEDRERIKQNVDWLIKARIMDKAGNLYGWSYGMKPPTGRGDNSNTQYALLGLYAGKTAGISIPAEVWQSIRKYYEREQLKDGGWTYSAQITPHGPGPSLTMTTAGICGLLIAGEELNKGREKPRGDGAFDNCGRYEENEPLARALRWLSASVRRPDGTVRDRFQLVYGNRTFYNLYGIERAGRLSGLRFLGKHDWYREGCKLLVAGDPVNDPLGLYKQHADGSWRGPDYYDQWPVISTSFALLFLSKGRTPVLISKLVSGPWPRQDEDADWNNDRNDLRHLTAFVSHEYFKKMPLAWQSFDIRRAVADHHGARREQEELEILSDMLQSPLVYLTGHKSPLPRFSSQEKDLLKKYVENGGFLLAEACCGSKDFDAGFRQLVRELWPDNDLTPLPAGHPVWSAFFPVPPGSFHLEGLHVGCKTVLIYSPEDLSCLWEANQFDTGRGQLAFRTGTNIVAYATGGEPPRPRLTETELAGVQEDRRTVPRGYLKVAQLKYPGDWQPAPRAMPNLLYHLHKRAGLDVALRTETLPVNHKDLLKFKFLYLHGRGDFHFEDDQLKELRFNLKTGGLLLADACCGNEAFDRAFRRFAKQLFPDHKLERVPPGDELFGKELNGETITEQNTRCRRQRNGPMQAMTPWLEGIKIDGRWVLLYSKYDLGCALERHQASDCVGYDHASALRIAGAAVLYLLRP
jgi:hypothetical protein